MLDWLVPLIAAAAIAGAAWLLVAAINHGRLPTSIEGLRIEVTAPLVAEDRVLEVVWEIPIIVSNASRRPRAVPVLKGEAHVHAGRALYVSTVTTVDTWELEDGRRLILNPGATAIASVWVTLPAGAVPRRLTLRQLRQHMRPLRAALPTPEPLNRKALA